MFRASRSWLVCSCLVLALGAYGCGDDNDAPDTPAAPSNPTPPTTTPPVVTPPQPSTFTISGTVTESAPTTFVRLQGVRVTLSNGMSRTTNSNGDYQFTDIPTGSYEVRAEVGGYQDQARNVTLSGGPATVNFELTPRETTIERTDTGRLGPDSSNCSGTSRPCVRYDFGVHYDGTLKANLEWVSSDADLDLVLVCDEQTIATAAASGSRGIEETMDAPLRRGQRCELRIIFQGGPDQSFVLDWSHPN